MHAGMSPIDHIADTIGGIFRRRRKALPPAPVEPQPLPPPRAHPVIGALTAAGRALNNLELAAAIGCSPGQASRLRRQVEPHVRTWRDGRCLYTALPGWQRLQ
ncbi:MAG: hypothetical protein WCZ28_06210 [Burkholderiaceae bacterium]